MTQYVANRALGKQEIVFGISLLLWETGKEKVMKNQHRRALTAEEKETVRFDSIIDVHSLDKKGFSIIPFYPSSRYMLAKQTVLDFHFVRN